MNSKLKLTWSELIWIRPFDSNAKLITLIRSNLSWRCDLCEPRISTNKKVNLIYCHVAIIVRVLNPKISCETSGCAQTRELWHQHDTVYITVSACFAHTQEIQQLQHASEAHIQITSGRHLVMKLAWWEAEWAVWFCCKCASKYCVTFQLGHFACDLHSFNISDCVREESTSLLNAIFSILHQLLFWAHYVTLHVHQYSIDSAGFSSCLGSATLFLTLSLAIILYMFSVWLLGNQEYFA